MYRHRRPWGGRSIIWLFFIPMFFFFGHGGFGILAWLFLMAAIFMIVRGLSRTWSNPTPTYQQPYQPYQPYQQPYQPYQPYQQQQNDYYQPMNEYQYPSYQQGYQENQAQEVHDAQPQRVVEQDEAYEQYEQPQTQYPQELPPMQ